MRRTKLQRGGAEPTVSIKHDTVDTTLLKIAYIAAVMAERLPVSDPIIKQIHESRNNISGFVNTTQPIVSQIDVLATIIDSVTRRLQSVPKINQFYLSLLVLKNTDGVTLNSEIPKWTPLLQTALVLSTKYDIFGEPTFTLEFEVGTTPPGDNDATERTKDGIYLATALRGISNRTPPDDRYDCTVPGLWNNGAANGVANGVANGAANGVANGAEEGAEEGADVEQPAAEDEETPEGGSDNGSSNGSLDGIKVEHDENAAKPAKPASGPSSGGASSLADTFRSMIASKQSGGAKSRSAVDQKDKKKKKKTKKTA